MDDHLVMWRLYKAQAINLEGAESTVLAVCAYGPFAYILTSEYFTFSVSAH